MTNSVIWCLGIQAHWKHRLCSLIQHILTPSWNGLYANVLKRCDLHNMLFDIKFASFQKYFLYYDTKCITLHRSTVYSIHNVSNGICSESLASSEIKSKFGIQRLMEDCICTVRMELDTAAGMLPNRLFWSTQKSDCSIEESETKRHSKEKWIHNVSIHILPWLKQHRIP